MPMQLLSQAVTAQEFKADILQLLSVRIERVSSQRTLSARHKLKQEGAIEELKTMRSLVEDVVFVPPEKK